MDPVLKATWVGRLRSGAFAQGDNCLRKDGKHCCLGVLADLMRPDAWERGEGGDGAFAMYGEEAILPGNLRAEAGLTRAECVTLMRMNDRGDSFATLADHIKGTL